MQIAIKMVDKATTALGVEDRRRELIIDALSRHLDNEAQKGQGLAIEEAIAQMIGDAEYLILRLGRQRARDALAELLRAL